MNPAELDVFDTVTTRAMHLCAARNDSRVNAVEFCDLVKLLVQVAVRDALEDAPTKVVVTRDPPPAADASSFLRTMIDPERLPAAPASDEDHPSRRRSDRRRIEADTLEAIKRRLRAAHGEKAARGGPRLALGSLDAICKDFGISKKTATTLSHEVEAELSRLLPDEPALAAEAPVDPPPETERFLDRLERLRVPVSRPPEPQHRALTEAERAELASRYAKACESSDELVPAGFAQTQAAAHRVPIKTIYDALDPAMKTRAADLESKKAAARLIPPPPRAERFKSRHVAGRYGGGET